MKRLIGPMAVLAVAGLLGIAVAQQVEQSGGEKIKPPRGQDCDRAAHRGQGPRHRMPSPIMRVLDADKDGELSADEIANASTALLTFDQDGDGVLSRDELQPPRPPRGEGFVEHVMSFDKDGDGLVTKAEMPERMQRLLERGDTNGDGAIDEAEATAAAEKMPRHGRPGGDGGRGGQRPDRGSQP